MTTRQFFGAALRVVAVWQLVEVLAQIPQIVWMLEQLAAGNSPAPYSYYLFGPVVRGGLAVALFLTANVLGGWLYPDPPEQA